MYKHDFWTTLISAFLASSISFAKLFSQAYILITLMPWIISLINLILSSVFLAVSLLNWENFFPTQLWKGTNARINTPPTKVALPILSWVSSTKPFPFHFYFLVHLHFFNLFSSLLALFSARIAFQMKVKYLNVISSVVIVISLYIKREEAKETSISVYCIVASSNERY